MHLKSYKELIVWQKSIQLVKTVFILTSKFPRSELYGITAQMRRAVVSIPSNIAEGCGRRSNNEYIHFYKISYGSALELETQMIIAQDLKFASTNAFIEANKLLEEICKMLNSMTQN